MYARASETYEHKLKALHSQVYQEDCTEDEDLKMTEHVAREWLSSEQDGNAGVQFKGDFEGESNTVFSSLIFLKMDVIL